MPPGRISFPTVIFPKEGCRLKKKVLILLAALLFILQLCSCSIISTIGSLGTERDDPIVGDGTSYTAFIKIMKEIKERGDKTAGMDMPVNSEYYYSFAGASVSAFRYAVEYILWLKGEGDTLASFTSGSRYSGFSVIAEINYSSPYPSYFEGLVYEVQGKSDEAIEDYAWASVMPAFPDEGLDFYYLKKMDVAKLYKLRDSLREVEESIYSVYSPFLTGSEWDRAMFDTEYLIALSSESVKNSDNVSALYYAKQALRINPFDELVWQNAAFCAICAEDFVLAGEYIDEATAIFPENAKLSEIKGAMLEAIEKEAP